MSESNNNDVEFQEEIFIEEIDLEAIGKKFEAQTLMQRIKLLMRGLKAPSGSREYKEALIELQRLLAPVGAILIPLIFIAILFVCSVPEKTNKDLRNINVAKAEDEASLEEPPPETTLILSTGNPASLLPTTISRCQQIPLPGNSCKYRFDGAGEVFRALEDLCFGQGGLVAAEAAAAALVRVANGLAAAAEKLVALEFADQLRAASTAEDPAFLKRLEARVADASSGAYMQERGIFLSAVLAFCQQVFLLSRGVAFSLLANPEVFPSGEPERAVSEEFGNAVLREAEELMTTLRFNVPEELAIRTFAVNIGTERRS